MMKMLMNCFQKQKESPKKSIIKSKEQQCKQVFELQVKGQFNKDNQINNSLKAGTFQPSSIIYNSQSSITTKTSIKCQQTQEDQEPVKSKKSKVSPKIIEKSETSDDTSNEIGEKSEAKQLTSEDFTDNLENVGTVDSSMELATTEEISLDVDDNDGRITGPITISGSGSESIASFGRSYGSIQWGIVRGGGRYNLRSKKKVNNSIGKWSRDVSERIEEHKDYINST